MVQEMIPLLWQMDWVPHAGDLNRNTKIILVLSTRERTFIL